MLVKLKVGCWVGRRLNTLFYFYIFKNILSKRCNISMSSFSSEKSISYFAYFMYLISRMKTLISFSLITDISLLNIYSTSFLDFINVTVKIYHFFLRIHCTLSILYVPTIGAFKTFIFLTLQFGSGIVVKSSKHEKNEKNHNKLISWSSFFTSKRF